MEVTYLGQPVGSVEVKREGLYCRILCRCENCGEMLRLYAGEEKLGLMMPCGGVLELQTRVAAKRIVEGCTFTLRGQEDFIPIQAGEPFVHLRQIKASKLTIRNGKMGIVL